MPPILSVNIAIEGTKEDEFVQGTHSAESMHWHSSSDVDTAIQPEAPDTVAAGHSMASTSITPQRVLPLGFHFMFSRFFESQCRYAGLRAISVYEYADASKIKDILQGKVTTKSATSLTRNSFIQPTCRWYVVEMETAQSKK